MAGKNNNRGLVLMGAAVTGGITGAIYMWSVFNKPLMTQYGWGAVEVSMAYSLYLLMVCIGGFFAGALQRRFPPKYLVLTGGVMMGIGYLLTGFVDSIAMLYVTFSLIGGLGNSFIYNTAVSTTIKWFPDKRGFANGICIGSMGLAPLVFAPLANVLIERFDAASAFKILGIGLIVAYCVFSWFLKVPEPGWMPAGWKGEGSQAGANAGAGGFSMIEMLKTPLFWLMWLIFACAATGGMMMTGQASGIGQSLANMTTAQGALMVGVLAVGNFLGRFAFGSLSDKIGRFQTLVICSIATSIAMACFPLATTFASFLAMIIIVGACFGGIMCIMPSLTGDAFGAANVGQNYAAVYSGYTCASFIGPTVASSCVATTGDYSLAFIVAATLSLASLVLIIVAWKVYKAMMRNA